MERALSILDCRTRLRARDQVLIERPGQAKPLNGERKIEDRSCRSRRNGSTSDSCTSSRPGRPGGEGIVFFRHRSRPCRPPARPIVSVPSVLDPFPHIPVHLVQSPGARGKAAHLDRTFPAHALGAARVRIVSVVVDLARCDRLAKGKRRRRSGPARILPFRSARQATGLPRLSR